MSLPEIISTTELSEVWGVTPQHVHRLAKEGVIPKGKNGKYPCKSTLLAFAKYQRETAIRARSDGASSRIKDARAREIELRIAQRERTLVPVTEAIAAMNIAIGAVRAEIEGAAANITRDRELRNRIQDAHDGILKRAAQRIDREVAALRGGGDVAEAVEEDDADTLS